MTNYKSTSDNDYSTTSRPMQVGRQSSSGAWIIGGIAALLLLLGIGYLASGNAPAPVGTPSTTQSTSEPPPATPAAPAEPAAPAATPAAPADPAAPPAPANPPAGNNSTTTQ